MSRRRGRLVMHLEPAESAALADLLADLAAVVTGVDDGAGAGDPVVQRLFPAAYPGDDGAQADYRAMTETGLRDERLGRIAACTAELHASGNQSTADVDLAAPDTSRRWIQTLNDLRLTLGTRIGITEDDAEPDAPAADDAHGQARLLYHWLTAVQDSVVSCLLV